MEVNKTTIKMQGERFIFSITTGTQTARLK